jgi:putative endonuclease
VFWRRRPKTNKELGRIGEDHAARFLTSRGYKIRERSFRLGRGAEADIVAEHNGVLVFVEVKSRTAEDEFAPRDQVNPRKQRQVTRAADAYLRTRERKERETRFDIVEVYLTPEGRVQRIEVLEGAFRAR